MLKQSSDEVVRKHTDYGLLETVSFLRDPLISNNVKAAVLLIPKRGSLPMFSVLLPRTWFEQRESIPKSVDSFEELIQMITPIEKDQFVAESPRHQVYQIEGVVDATFEVLRLDGPQRFMKSTITVQLPAFSGGFGPFQKLYILPTQATALSQESRNSGGSQNCFIASFIKMRLENYVREVWFLNNHLSQGFDHFSENCLIISSWPPYYPDWSNRNYLDEHGQDRNRFFRSNEVIDKFIAKQKTKSLKCSLFVTEVIGYTVKMSVYLIASGCKRQLYLEDLKSLDSAIDICRFASSFAIFVELARREFIRLKTTEK